MKWTRTEDLGWTGKLKIRTCAGLIALILVTSNALSGEVSITEKGPNHRVWSKTVQQQLPSGKIITRTVPAYSELATGLHHWSDTQKDWIESSTEIEIVDGAAMARNGAYRIKWAANANTAGAVDLTSPDGKRFRSHLLGVAFTDTRSGASFFIATTKDSIGQVIANQVVYQDAFDGINADIIYTYANARFEQDIMFREALPDPSGPPWNLNADSTVVEVYTEFIDPPQASTRSLVLKSEPDQAMRRLMAEPDIIDQHLDFGATEIGTGSAFTFGGKDAAKSPVIKSWETRDQRHVLIERIEYRGQQFAALAKPAPLGKAQLAKVEAHVARDPNGIPHAILPARPRATVKLKTEPMRMAQSLPSRNGFVLDYSQVITATNVTFKADTTYYVSGPVTLSGTTTFEGGCVVKYAPTNGATIQINGPVVCQTAPYRMAIFTARDDQSIGEHLSTNAVSGTYATVALDLDGTSNTFDLSYLRISYAATALDFSHGFGHLLSHSQLVKCNNAFTSTSTDFKFRNVLIYSMSNICNAAGLTTTSRWEHVTLDTVRNFNNTTNGSFFLTNCLLVAVTNTGPYSGTNNSSSSNPATVFQTVGGGSHYLATNSAYRDIGTTNINSALLASIRKKTTYPPLVITNSITTNTTWAVRATRDTDTPDLGWHYDPIDYACDSIIITNSTLTLSNGVRTAGYVAAALWVQDGATVVSEASPNNHNVICRYNTAQEQSTNWGAAGSELLLGYHYGSVGGNARFRFTDFMLHPVDGMLLYCQYQWSFGSLSVRDCEFYVGDLYIGGTTNTTSGFTNNLAFRVPFNIFGDGKIGFYNNLYYRDYVYIDNAGTISDWVFKDNFFDGAVIDDSGNITNDFNAYLNVTGYLTAAPTNHDLVLTNFTYATGPLGAFYQYSTNLVDKGSVTNAGLRALYHYTTQTNQVKEANSKLDIGYHYVAGNSVTGVPTDTDGDGLADYFEDTNGNGVFDAGETDWQH